jgi:hypothetical protein
LESDKRGSQMKTNWTAIHDIVWTKVERHTTNQIWIKATTPSVKQLSRRGVWFQVRENIYDLISTQILARVKYQVYDQIAKDNK